MHARWPWLLLALHLPVALADPGLEQRWQRLQTLETVFVQEQRDVDGVLLERSAGHFALARPGRFRWDYTEPHAQTLVSDGATLWAHDPDLRQATRRPAAEALAGTPAEVLAGSTPLLERFIVEALATRGGEDGWRLTPRARDAEFSQIELWMRDEQPLRLIFLDALGGSTELRFEQARLNPRLPDQRFRFEPPRDTDVVDLR